MKVNAVARLKAHAAQAGTDEDVVQKFALNDILKVRDLDELVSSAKALLDTKPEGNAKTAAVALSSKTNKTTLAELSLNMNYLIEGFIAQSNNLKQLTERLRDVNY